MIGLVSRVIWVLILAAAAVGAWVIATELGILAIGLVAAPDRWPRDDDLAADPNGGGWL